MDNLQYGVIAITFGVITIATLLIYWLFKHPSDKEKVVHHHFYHHHLPEKSIPGDDGVVSPSIEREIEEPAEQIRESQMPATPKAYHSHYEDSPPSYHEATSTRSSPQLIVKPESDYVFSQSPELAENKPKARSFPQLIIKSKDDKIFAQLHGSTETTPKMAATGIIATEENMPVKMSKNDQAALDDQEAPQNSMNSFVTKESTGEKSLHTSIKNVHKEEEPQKTYVDVPQHKWLSPVETFTFNVDKKGCHVDTPYCKLYFPPGATKDSSCIRMTPIYERQACELGSNAITPTVDFDYDEELTFDKDVEIELHTSYAALRDNVAVKVIWRKDRSGEFGVLKDDVPFGKGHFVRFSTRHFCQFCVVADESQFRNMLRHFYSAIYCRKPKSNRSRLVHWLLYDFCPAISSKQHAYLSDKDILVDPEIFRLKYGFDLQLKLNSDSDVCIKSGQGSNLTTISFSNNWTTPFSKNFQFNISRESERNSEQNVVKHEILAVDPQFWSIIKIQEGHFFLEWQHESPNVMVRKQFNVNVTGDRSVGFQTNMHGTGQALMQPQTSNISDASSGYSSQLNSPSADHSFPEFRSSDQHDSMLSQVVEEISSAENVPADQVNEQDANLTRVIPDVTADTRPKSKQDESEILSLQNSTEHSTPDSKEPVNQETCDKVFQS